MQSGCLHCWLFSFDSYVRSNSWSKFQVTRHSWASNTTTYIHFRLAVRWWIWGLNWKTTVRHHTLCWPTLSDYNLMFYGVVLKSLQCRRWSLTCLFVKLSGSINMWRQPVLCICIHACSAYVPVCPFYPLCLLQRALDMTVDRQAGLCVCVWMCMCQQKQGRGTLPLWRGKGGGVEEGAGVRWMTFGPAAGSCSVLLFPSDPADPRHSPWCHTHTFTHLHIARHMTAHTHTHRPAQACM